MGALLLEDSGSVIRVSASLRKFAKWFLSQPFAALRPPQNAIYHYELAAGKVQSIVLYRKAPFQVELISAIQAEGWEGAVPEHSHPNIDSIEYMLAGQTDFTICGQPVATDAEVNGIDEDGASLMCGKRMHVAPGVLHGASLGQAGGVFLSIQQWKPGIEPSSVGLDWDGPPHQGIRAA